MWFSLAAVVGLVITLGFNLLAWRQARTGIKAFEDTERAWLLPVAPEEILIGDAGDGPGYWAAFSAKNTGRSPATITSVRWAGTSSRAWHDNFAGMDVRSRSLRTSVEPGTHRVASLEFNAVARADFVVGQVIYDTLFAKDCVAHFLWRLGSEDDQGHDITVWPVVVGDDWPRDT